MAKTENTHPEAKPGEIFLSNCSSDEPDDFDSIGYQTKRAGFTAYDTNNQIISHMFPVFVWETEYNKVMGEVKVEIVQ
jgi:hypothetical protein